MSVSITNPGVGGILVETDPTALKLTGGTLTGKLIGTATPTNAALSVGTLTANPTSLSNGDIWIVDRLNFVNRLGNIIGVVTTNQASTITTSSSNNVIQIDQNGNGGGLLVRSTTTSAAMACVRIEQRGSGHALLVQDSQDPDSTPFVVTNNGQTVIGGLTPYSTASLTVNGGASIESGSYYVRVGSSGVEMYGQLVLTSQTTISGTANFSDYNNDLAVSVNGQTIYIPYRT